jgi:hypothetical protein
MIVRVSRTSKNGLGYELDYVLFECESVEIAIDHAENRYLLRMTLLDKSIKNYFTKSLFSVFSNSGLLLVERLPLT